MDRVDRQQKYKALYEILQLLLFQGSHLDNFPPKTLKLGWVAFDSTRFQLKCLDIRNSSQSSHVFAMVYGDNPLRGKSARKPAQDKVT